MSIQSEYFKLASQMVELSVAAMELRTRADVAEARLKGAEERSQLLLDAKNMWMDRAIAAEKIAYRPTGAMLPPLGSDERFQSYSDMLISSHAAAKRLHAWWTSRAFSPPAIDWLSIIAPLEKA